MKWQISKAAMAADAVELASMSPQMRRVMVDILLFGKSMEDDPRFAKANSALDDVIERKKPCQS